MNKQPKLKVNSDPWFSTQLINRADNWHTFFQLIFHEFIIITALYKFYQGSLHSTYDNYFSVRENFGISISNVIYFDLFSDTFSNLVIALSASCLTKKEEKIPQNISSLPRDFKRTQKGFLEVAKALSLSRFWNIWGLYRISQNYNHFNNIILSV